LASGRSHTDHYPQPDDGDSAGDASALNGNRERFFGVQWQLLLSHVEVALGAAGVGALAAAIPLLRGDDPATAVLYASAALLVSAIGGATVGLRFARRVKARLREAGRFASTLARGEYGSRISPGPPDEIGQLEQELNAMAESLEAAIAGLSDLAERNRRLAEEAGSLAALEERTRLARDLHDTVNQEVFSLSMQAAAARRRLEAAVGDPERLGEVGAMLSGVEELARSAHRQMRELILQLRPTTLEERGLGPALEEYARAFSDKEGLECACRIDFWGRLDREAEEALFRAAQEALNNVAKHAEATEVTVRLELTPATEVLLEVADNGRGFERRSASRPTALGLKGLRERAASVGGRVKVKSAPGKGTAVRVVCPVAGRDGAENASGRAAGEAAPHGAGRGAGATAPCARRQTTVPAGRRSIDP